jgi:uncharacterized OB-fold protein
VTNQAAEKSTYTKPLPHLTKVNTPYWEALKNHELRLPKCRDCGHIWHPPASRVCPNCLSIDNYDFEKMSGRGKIWGWLRMHQRYFPGFADDLPYNIVYVELDDQPGLRMISNLVHHTEEDLRCDQAVEIVFDDVTPEWTLPKFQPVKS